MSYLKFDKSLLINLDQSLKLEMLRTNRLGAYHCTTLTDCNTRRQHGLLVTPLPDATGEPHVLLSSLDETVVQHGAEFNLALHRYAGGAYSPNGHKYIREFDCERVPSTTYRVGGVILTKEKIFISDENRILIRYTLREAHSPTTLRLRPMLAFRRANDICVANDRINTTVQEVKDGIACCLYDGYPTLYMQLSVSDGKFVSRPDWYRNFEYIKDIARTEGACEDLWTPGYLELPIKPGQSVIFSAGVAEADPMKLQAMYEAEMKSRTCRTSFFNCLKNAAKQFYIRPASGGMYIITRYPWGDVRARDLFMALPGSTLCIDHPADFHAIMQTGLDALMKFLDKGVTDPVIRHLDSPDVPLWALWALQEYAVTKGMDEARDKYAKAVGRLMEAILADAHPNLHVDDRGLIETAGHHTAASWMTATMPGSNRPIVPRTGLLVELNALWYDALCFASDITGSERYASIANGVAPAFIDTFLNEAGYLWDYVDQGNPNPEVRPNMAIAIGLRHTPLSRRQRKGVLDVVTRELLTPKGLRTLSPKSGAYRPTYVGTPEERALALHNGTARPWLMGFYASAYLGVFGPGGVGYIDRMLIGFEEEMSQGCIGSLSQLYDGNPPYDGHGAISHAVNVAEVLRALVTLKDFERAEDRRYREAMGLDEPQPTESKPAAKGKVTKKSDTKK